MQRKKPLLKQATNLGLLSFAITYSINVMAQAASQTAVVKQVFTERGRVIAESTILDLKVQDELIVTLESKQQCALPILEIRGNILTLNSYKCRYRDEIKPGLQLEKSLLSETQVATNPPDEPSKAEKPEKEPTTNDTGSSGTESRKKRFLVGAAFSGRTIAFGTSGSATGVAGSFTSDFEYKEALSFCIEMRDSQKNAWGYGLGLTFDMERELESAIFKSGSSSLSLVGSGGASKIGATAIEFNAIYRWNEFYIPFGLNYTAMRFTPAPGYSGGFNVDSGFGAQFGLGFFINDNVAIEMSSRASNYSLNFTQGGSFVNFGNLIYSIVTFGVKGKF